MPCVHDDGPGMQCQWEKQLIQSIEYNSTSSCTLHHAIAIRTLFNRLFGATNCLCWITDTYI
jgi:hypothetical protein